MFTILLHIDHNLFWFINSLHCAFLDNFFLITTNLGNGWVVTPVLLLIAFIKVPRQKLGPFIISATLFMVGSGLINTQIKQSLDRQRPLTFFANETGPRSDKQYPVHAIGERLYHNSFPSGHSNTAFAAATLLALSFGGMYWLAFVVAGFVGYSRIYLGTHFPSDVVAGALLGFIVMWIWFKLYLWYDRRKAQSNDKE
jgi:membrane-associated phospholipid phosphatase